MDVVVNGKAIRYNDYIYAIRDLMVFHLPHIKFQPTDHAKANLIGQVDQFNEVLFLEKERAGTKETKRKITSVQKKLAFFKTSLGFCKSSQSIQNKVYEFILSAEQLGALHGFGFSNMWGDKIKGDAERQSMRKIG